MSLDFMGFSLATGGSVGLRGENGWPVNFDVRAFLSSQFIDSFYEGAQLRRTKPSS
jgi:hypothetical protein